MGDTPAILLSESTQAPRAVSLDGKPLTSFAYSAKEQLLWIHFQNDVVPREVAVQY